MSKTQKSSNEVATFTSSLGSKYSVPSKYASCKSVSEIIRSMSSDGYTRASIAKITNIRYQHVRNVLLQPLKK